VPARYPLVVASSTRTRYAKSGDLDIAYQVLGDGPIDLLLYTGWLIPIDCMDEEPSMARFQRRLASFSRLCRFDMRGVGLSDRGSASSPPTREQWVQDALAVLDAVGSERSVVLAPYGNSADGLMLAAMHPERTTSLIVVNGFARVFWAPDYPHGARESLIDVQLNLSAESDAIEQGFDFLAWAAPSVDKDSAFRTWWDRSGNLGATPAMARAIWTAIFATDVRHLLSLIEVPTLVIQRTDIKLGGVDHGRYLVDHIAGAKYVGLPGADVVHWVGDCEPMLDEIEEFITGVRGGSGAERILVTVLFTDIVGSTTRAASLGDRRWRDLLDRHHQSVRSQIQRFRGREVDTAGDGFFATFDSPGRAIECAIAIREALRVLDIEVRAGIHTGEVEVRGDDLAGLAVHIGARVSTLAAAGELLVTSTVRDLLTGSSTKFIERGAHELKGVPGSWRLFAVDG
jgi:class 3 adenylate cyclase/pimeloyl-ACP methyl ester carboxylesterase